MWVIGAGIMISGLLSMVFIPLPIGLIIVGAGGIIAIVTEELKKTQEEDKNNAWRKSYPTYKY